MRARTGDSRIPGIRLGTDRFGEMAAKGWKVWIALDAGGGASGKRQTFAIGGI